MDVKIEKKGDLTILFIIGRLDASSATELEIKLNEINEKDPHNTVLSLKELIYISSAGLRVLLSFAKKLHAGKKQLYFSELEGNVKSVFEISGFYSIFKVYETIEEAIKKAESAV